MQKLNEKQIKQLLAKAKSAIENKETLTSVFKSFANKYCLSAGSVRNIYYKTIKEGNGGELKAKRVILFEQDEAIQMLKSALTKRKKHSSMRQVFLDMAKGDKKLALRYQNKYCSMLKNQRGLVMREILAQKRKIGDCYNPYADKKHQLKRLQLKREIDYLIKKIGEKCSKENALLKRKLCEYEKLSICAYSEEGGNFSQDSVGFFKDGIIRTKKAEAN